MGSEALQLKLLSLIFHIHGFMFLLTPHGYGQMPN